MDRRGTAFLTACLLELCAPRFAGAVTSEANVFRWAAEGDAASMDPYTRNETQQLSLTGNVYEPLVRHGLDMALEPALAVSWQQLAPTKWRFHLRPGVRWQDGSAFSADDVLFSLGRVQNAASLLRPVMASVVSAAELDPLTVDLTTAAPDPILPQELTTWYILSKTWTEAHDAAKPASLAAGQQNHATRHAMGTGPYRLVEREPDVKTVFEANPLWWDTGSGRPARAEFFTIANPGTRVAALLAGDVDLTTSLPPPDLSRVEGNVEFRVLRRTELRTIFLGLSQARAVLVHGSGGEPTPNPLRRREVRQAIALAIDEDLIASRIMHGAAHATALLWGPGVTGYAPALDHRPKPDLKQARALLAQAGYPGGFAMTLDCPNDRYVMDEAICTAIPAMLARIGIQVQAHIQPKVKFFSDIGPPGYATDFYLLGWTPGTADAHDALLNLAATRAGTHGAINYGGYSNPALDALIDRIGGEADAASRTALLDQAAQLLLADVAYIPLHQQELLWAAREGVKVGQMPDGTLPLRLVRLGP